jgi:hypothetical protein
MDLPVDQLLREFNVIFDEIVRKRFFALNILCVLEEQENKFPCSANYLVRSKHTTWAITEQNRQQILEIMCSFKILSLLG